jgi:prepilin-type N-terminal cleavage/methylation domain-containing protein
VFEVFEVFGVFGMFGMFGMLPRVASSRLSRVRLRRARGFTLVELMIAIVIVVILMAFGVSGLREWSGRASVRAGMENVQNALQIAQSEAVRRNQLVEFSLLASRPAPVSGSDNVSVVNTAAAENGAYWVVRVPPEAGATSTDKVFVQGGDLGSRGVKVTGGATLLFDGLGQPRAVSAPSAQLAATQVYRVTSSNDEYPVCVFARPGGGIRWCDPTLKTGTPLECPADVTCPST